MQKRKSMFNRKIEEQTYHCKLTGQLVHYLVSAPVLALKKYKLLVNLHSCHREPVELKRFVYLANLELDRWSEVEGLDNFIIIHPLGFGNSLFLGVGEMDIFNCINDINTKYNIDNNSISLVGFSMGGAAALNIATQYPDFFNCVCSISGYTNFNYWEGPNRKKYSIYEKKELEKIDAFFSVENLKFTNLLIAHGEWDRGLGGGVDFKFHQILTTRLDELNIEHKNIIYEQTSHAEFPLKRRKEVIDWVNRQSKKKFEGTFVFKIRDLRHSDFFGISTLSIETPAEVSEIKGVVNKNIISISTKNINSLEVDESRYPEVYINSIKTSSFTKSYRKRKGLSGPISDIKYTRIIFCYDDKCQDNFSKSFQKEIALADLKYFNKFNGGISCGAFRTGEFFFENQVKAYSQLDETSSTDTLVLYGTPKTNKKIDTLLRDAKILIEKETISFANEHIVKGEYGIRFIYPNDSGGYSIINTGTNEYIISKSFGIWYALLPDYIIYDHCDVKYFGYFDYNWKFSKKQFFEV